MNPITPLTPEQTQAQEDQAAKEGFLKRDAIAIDIAADEILFDGPMDETISSRAARAAVQGKLWGKLLSAALNWFEKDHGAKAQAGDLERAKNLIRIEESAGDLNKHQ